MKKCKCENVTRYEDGHRCIKCYRKFTKDNPITLDQLEKMYDQELAKLRMENLKGFEGLSGDYERCFRNYTPDSKVWTGPCVCPHCRRRKLK